MIRTLLFDVNETLLDLSALKPRFAQVFGSPDPIGEWFARMLHASLVCNHLDAYRPFGELGVAQLLALARRRGVEIDQRTAEELVSGMRDLPAHPDVEDGLGRLTGAGFRLATLTNGAPEVVADQLANAGIASFFEQALSVEEVRRFKPDPEPYHHAVRTLGVGLGEAMMVAAHDWDIAGALAAGLGGAFIARGDTSWTIAPAIPHVTAPDLRSLSEVLIERFRDPKGDRWPT